MSAEDEQAIAYDELVQTFTDPPAWGVLVKGKKVYVRGDQFRLDLERKLIVPLTEEES